MRGRWNGGHQGEEEWQTWSFSFGWTGRDFHLITESLGVDASDSMQTVTQSRPVEKHCALNHILTQKFRAFQVLAGYSAPSLPLVLPHSGHSAEGSMFRRITKPFMNNP